MGFVEQTLRSTPKGEIYGAALLLVVKRRKGLGFLERRPVVIINPEIECVVAYHPEHESVAEHASLAKHAPQGDATERCELIAQEFSKAVAGSHRFQNPCDGMRNARLKREDAFSQAMIIVSSAMVSSS